MSVCRSSRRWSTRSQTTTQVQHHSLPTRNEATYPTNYSQIADGITFKTLPFYDLITDIVKPTTLHSNGILGVSNESKVLFSLSVSQADTIAMSIGDNNVYSKQVLLRFCYFDKNTEQDDNFPHDVSVQVNGVFLNLPPTISNPNKPNIPPKRPGKPLDITNYCKLSPFATNLIKVKWFSDPLLPSRSYVINVLFVTRLDSTNLLDRIKERSIIEESYTREFVKGKLASDEDCEIATETLQASLICPLGKMRMRIPCKSITCDHMPCFDALFYLQMNEKKATWICPVCSQPALFKDLKIDGMFADILVKTEPHHTEVQFNKDGSWIPITKRDDHNQFHEHPDQPPLKKPPVPPIEIVTISDSSDDDYDGGEGGGGG